MVTTKDQNDKTYASDSEVYYHHLHPRTKKGGPTVRGGGFTVRPQQLTPERDRPEVGSKLGEMKQLDRSASLIQVHGNNFNYFCPKRFNRYPRFTIFFNKKKQFGVDQKLLQLENTVNLGPQFLSYLMAKNEDLPAIEDLESLGQHTYSKTSRDHLPEKPDTQVVETAKIQAQEKNTLQETSKNSSIL